jgi:hypothetical protein
MLLPLLGMGPKVKEGERGGRFGFEENHLSVPPPGWVYLRGDLEPVR